MPEYRIKVARTNIETFIVQADNPADLENKWPEAMGWQDPVESYSEGDELISFEDEDGVTTVMRVHPND